MLSSNPKPKPRHFRSRFNACWMFVIGVTSFACSGCYPDWPEHAGTAVIQGNITLDGLPLGETNVAFVPVSLHATGSKIMPIAYGTTDAGGDFDLAYVDGVKDILAGNYNVIVSKVEDSDEAQPSDLPPGLIPDSMKNFEVFSSHGEQVPLIYNRNSTLEYEIVASPSIVKPEFKLSSVDPELDELPVIDLPIK